MKVTIEKREGDEYMSSYCYVVVDGYSGQTLINMPDGVENLSDEYLDSLVRLYKEGYLDGKNNFKGRVRTDYWANKWAKFVNKGDNK